jgi:hypothetical protein
MMLKIKIPPESGNRAVKDGTMAKAFESLNAKIKPEAVYFSMEDGMRCAFFFYDVAEEYQFLEIHEPLFAAMGALVYDAPALTWDDMAKGWQHLQGQ